MAAFARTPAVLREIDRFYPRHQDIRDAQGPIDALDLLFWPADQDGRQLVWQARQGPIGAVYPPWFEIAPPVTLHYRRLCTLLDPEDRPGPPRPATYMNIQGTHSTAWPGPIKVSEDISMWRLAPSQVPAPEAAPIYRSPTDTLRAVATFDATLANDRYRFDYVFGEGPESVPTPILYTVISATGAWATATNLVIVYGGESPLREVAILRGNRE